LNGSMELPNWLLPEDRVACIPLKLTERNERGGGD
jgi:hypothetical protein